MLRQSEKMSKIASVVPQRQTSSLKQQTLTCQCEGCHARHARSVTYEALYICGLCDGTMVL